MVYCNGLAMVAPWVLERRSSQGAKFRLCLTDWLIREQNQPQSIVDVCMLLLEESYLLSLRLPPRVVLPAVPGPRNFRFLFCRHVASLLGWTERREEGEFHGFSDSVNKFVREIWWPDEAAEALHRPRPDNRQSSAIPNPQVIGPVVVDVLPTSDTADELRRLDGCVMRGSAEQSTVDPTDPVPRSGPRGEVRSRPIRPQTMMQGVQAGSSTGSEAAFDQQVFLRSGDFPGGRLIRQRLELGAGGTVLLHQSLEGLLPPRAEEEGTSEVAGHEDNIPTRVAKKKPVRKRHNASSSGK